MIQLAQGVFAVRQNDAEDTLPCEVATGGAQKCPAPIGRSETGAEPGSDNRRRSFAPQHCGLRGTLLAVSMNGRIKPFAVTNWTDEAHIAFC